MGTTGYASRRLAYALLLLGMCVSAAAQPARPECIAPSKTGGSLDLVCRLAQSGLTDTRQLPRPMRIRYLPGDAGMQAYDAVATLRPADGQTIAAFSSGTLMHLANGRVRSRAVDVRWLAAIGVDYGIVAVPVNSPYKTLKALVAALKANPRSIVFGAGASIGSDDWMKTALIARQAGVDHHALRYVTYDGGGEAISALVDNHVQAMTGDISDAVGMFRAGRIRILAVFSEQRLPGRLASIPTAREQGVDLVWPVVRGFYMGPKVSDDDFLWWETAFRRMQASKPFTNLRDALGLLPFNLTGVALDAHVRRELDRYAQLSREFELMR